MAGLSVLLETGHENQPGTGRPPAQIISKATLLHRCANKQPAASAGSLFLQRCSLCRKELREGTDIYMYRGDRAFCSVECRGRQIFMDEDAAAAERGRTRRAGGGFAL
ncbi:hypothetical protein ACP4OV_006004 [Aristida adscensionis]